MSHFDDDQRPPVVQIYGPGTEKPAPVDAVMTLLIKLPALFDRVKERFDASAPAPAAVDIREFVS